MDVHFKLLDGVAIQAYAKQLQNIEQSIQYPLSEAGDHFTIVHGTPYHGFFSAMGKALFILAMHGESVIGSIAAVWKPVTVNNQSYTALYLADLKLSKQYRGKKIIHRMIWFALKKWLTNTNYRGWDFVFFAAMKKAAMKKNNDDVTRSFSGFHLGKLVKVSCTLDIYFCSCKELLSLDNRSPLLPSLHRVACLSQIDSNIRNNSGTKDFKLQSTGKPWQLIHLPIPPGYWSNPLDSYLRHAAHEQSLISESVTLCFSLDSRLTELKRWLIANSIKPGAACSIYSCPNTLFGVSPIDESDFIHLDTSQI
ncbi:hypothetical protein [Endozoicomonas sp. YOMI1]|uniref:hypothetical protein n=1 Tax=Endozoicomonas sp. YOMI1 TaxID=2828739 RepID=UPI002147FAD3|nr:hypothetical protein [Endozoicomonas sp. YOMI1]